MSITGQDHNNTPPPRKGEFAFSCTCIGDNCTLTIKGSVRQAIKTIGAILATLLTSGTVIASPYLEEARFKYLPLPQADPRLIDRPASAPVPDEQPPQIPKQ